MSKLLYFTGFLLLLPLLLVSNTVSYAQDPGVPGNPSVACLAFKYGLSLGAPLAHIKKKLRAGRTLTVVALGSSSTTGFGTFRSDAAFPDVMKRELLRGSPALAEATHT